MVFAVKVDTGLVVEYKKVDATEKFAMAFDGSRVITWLYTSSGNVTIAKVNFPFSRLVEVSNSPITSFAFNQGSFDNADAISSEYFVIKLSSGVVLTNRVGYSQRVWTESPGHCLAASP